MIERTAATSVVCDGAPAAAHPQHVRTTTAGAPSGCQPRAYDEVSGRTVERGVAMTIDELKRAALRLDPSTRASLARDLLAARTDS